jgi:transposase
MANILNVHEQEAIERLHKLGWGIRKIARELQLHRKTVRRYIEGAEGASKCTTISTPGSPPKCTISTSGKMGRKSDCLPHAQFIRELLDKDLSAQRIYQDLQKEVGFTGSYQSVKRYVRQLRPGSPERVQRVEVAPGEEAQVDFGRGADIIDPQKRKKKSWVFRMVLSHSRKGYSEAVFHQNTESFLRCLENAFLHFGGVPRTLNLDNLKAAVLRSHWAEPELNPKLAEFARHYGTIILPCLPRTPEHKGKVERGIGYVKNNALAGRTFESLAQENACLVDWEAKVADLRIHGTTKRQVRELFLEEKKALLPLPPSLFPCFEEAPRTVHRDSYVEVAKSYYRVPPEYIGERMWVRWDMREVRIYNSRMEQVQVHRRLEPGRFSKALGIGGGQGSLQSNLQYWLTRAQEMGAPTSQWAQGLVDKRGAEAIRSLMGLVGLNKRHSFRSINEACAKAIAKNLWRLRDVTALLESQSPEVQTHFSFAEHHPLIRNLQEYGLFIQSSQTF